MQQHQLCLESRIFHSKCKLVLLEFRRTYLLSLHRIQVKIIEQMYL